MLAVFCVIGMLHASDAQAIALKDYSTEAMILDESMDVSIPRSQSGIGKIKNKHPFHFRPPSEDSTPDIVAPHSWQMPHYGTQAGYASPAPRITACPTHHRHARAPPTA